MFKGTGTAVVTPFKSGEVDFEGYRRFVAFQLESGVNALIVLGTTGESPNVNERERSELIKIALKEADGKIPVIVGTGTNSTAKTIESSERALEEGADGVLVVTPYYNKPTQEGLYRHYAELATRLKGPLIIYNVPSRTGVNMLPETVLKCAKFENIAGVKEASGNQYQVDSLIKLLREANSHLKVWSGNDDQAFHLCCSGGDGVISVMSNVAPSQTVEMVEAVLAGDLDKARQLHLKLLPLMNALFIETNPIPVKYAVHLLGYCENELRLPLVELTEKGKETLRRVLKDCGVMS